MNEVFEADLAERLKLEAAELAPPPGALTPPAALAAGARRARRRHRRTRRAVLAGGALAATITGGFAVAEHLPPAAQPTVETTSAAPVLAPLNDEDGSGYIAPRPAWTFAPGQALVEGVGGSPEVLTGSSYDPATGSFRLLTTDLAAGQRLADEVEATYGLTEPVAVVLTDHSLQDLTAMSLEVAAEGEVAGQPVTFTQVSPPRGVFGIGFEEPTDAARAELHERYGDAVEVMRGSFRFGTADGTMPPLP